MMPFYQDKGRPHSAAPTVLDLAAPRLADSKRHRRPERLGASPPSAAPAIHGSAFNPQKGGASAVSNEGMWRNGLPNGFTRRIDRGDVPKEGRRSRVSRPCLIMLGAGNPDGDRAVRDGDQQLSCG